MDAPFGCDYWKYLIHLLFPVSINLSFLFILLLPQFHYVTDSLGYGKGIADVQSNPNGSIDPNKIWIIARLFEFTVTVFGRDLFETQTVLKIVDDAVN